MKSLKVYFNLFASLCMVFSSSAAYGANVKVSLPVLNQVATPIAMVGSARGFFKTKEDQYKITYDYLKVEALSKKWIWRFESEGDKIVFRVNGNPMFSVKPINVEKGLYEVNGKEFNLKSGLSYQAQSEKFQKLVMNSQVNLDFLFFDEAHAIPPLLLFGFLGLTLFGVAAGTQAQAAHQQQYGQCTISPVTSGQAHDIARRKSRCTGRQGMKLVSGNFRKACSTGHVRGCGPYAGESYRCKNWDTINECIEHKVQRRNGGWGLSSSEARVVCTQAFQAISCTEPTPTTTTTTTTTTDSWGPAETCPKTNCGDTRQRGIMTNLCQQGISDCCNQLRQPRCGGGGDTWGPSESCPKTNCRDQALMLRLFQNNGIRDCMVRYNTCNNSRERVSGDRVDTPAGR